MNERQSLRLCVQHAAVAAVLRRCWYQLITGACHVSYFVSVLSAFSALLEHCRARQTERARMQHNAGE